VRRGEADVRSDVFAHGIRVLNELGRWQNNTMLKFYILEHVTGSLKAKRGERSFAAVKMDELRTVLPHFVHHLWTENSINHALAHNRPRIFFVGVHKMCMEALGRPELDQPMMKLGYEHVSLADILDTHDQMPDIFSTRTPKQIANINHYQEKMEAKMINDPSIRCAQCDHSRNPRKAFGEFIRFDALDCLTTGDTSKWVLGNVPGKVWSFGRPLTVAERARAQGIVPESLDCVQSRTKKISMLGNTISVDVIGAVFASICPAMVAFERGTNAQLVRVLPPADTQEDNTTD
jgi:site-specific DNA-cytosine methylase